MDSRAIARQDRLAYQVVSLRERVARLEARSQRFSWYRLAALVGGSVITFVGMRVGTGNSGWWAVLFALIIFTGVVILHRRLERWIIRLKIWLDIRSGQLARLALDWDHIPEPRPLPGWQKSSLETDLDLTGPHSLHQLLDISSSQGGSRLLADWLTRPEPEDPGHILVRQALVKEVAAQPRFRDRLQLAFRLVSPDQLDGRKLLRWLEETYPLRRLGWVVPVASLLVAVNLILFVFNTVGRLPPYWLASLVVYAAFYFYHTQVLNDFLEAVVQLDSEVDKFRVILLFLESYPLHGCPSLLELLAPFRRPDQIPSREIRQIKLITAGVGLRSNPILGFLINLILPWDFFFAYLAATRRDRAAEFIPAWLQVWQELDAVCCLADFAYLHPEYSYPEIDPHADPVLEAKGLGHPLLPPKAKIVNDITVARVGEVEIITGSNMAGKSTFIKTIGVNYCLAYAGAPVDARSFRTAPFSLHSCIRISDSLSDGYSYFYAEVQCLKRLLNRVLADQPWPVLFLVDEIFRGTNNRERLIGSRSFLTALTGKNCVGFLATHDLELASLAARNVFVRNFHFRDRVADGRLVFDYRLHGGPSPTTNALKIMRMEGLPVDIQEEEGEE